MKNKHQISDDIFEILNKILLFMGKYAETEPSAEFQKTMKICANFTENGQFLQEAIEFIKKESTAMSPQQFIESCDQFMIKCLKAYLFTKVSETRRPLD
jgi:hypothetical protein